MDEDDWISALANCSAEGDVELKIGSRVLVRLQILRCRCVSCSL